MKILRKNILILAIVFTIFGAANIVTAETDDTGDLWHYEVFGTSASWEAYSGSKDYIDITNIDYSISGSEATLTMTLAGNIQDSETILYYMHLVMGTDYYNAWYTNGMGLVTGVGGTLTGYYSMLTSPVSGNTFTATFTVNDPSATYEVRGYAQELSELDDETAEWWGDWAPNTYFYDYSGYNPEEEEEEEEEEQEEEEEEEQEEGEENDKDKGSPGFEVIVFIAAITIAILFIRRKK